jgi:hypothetical protein
MVSLAHGALITFQPRVSVNETYTDNTYLSDTNPVEEYITTVTPGATLAVTGKRYGLEASYDAGYAMYKNNTNDDTWRHTAEASLWADLSKHIRLDINDTFLKTDEPTTEEQYFFVVQQVDGKYYGNIGRGFVVGRNHYYVNAANALLTYQFGENDRLLVSYLHSLRNEDAVNANDNQEHRPSAQLIYWFTPQFGVDTSVTYTRGLFDRGSNFDDFKGDIRLNRKVTRHTDFYLQYEHLIRGYDDPGQPDYRIFKPSVGVSLRPSKHALIDIGVGYFIQHKDNTDNQEGFTLDATVSKSWAYRRGSVDLVALSGLDRNDFGSERLGLERYYGVSLSGGYSLSRELSAHLDSSYRRNEYLDIANDRTDYQVVLGGGLSYRMLRWLYLNATYTHRLLRSNDASQEYTENRVTFSISLVPAYPYKL